MPDKTSQLKSILQLLGTSATKAEVQDAFKVVIKYVQDLKQSNAQEWAMIRSAVSMLGDKLAKDNETEVAKEVSRIEGLVLSKVGKSLKEQEEGMKFIYDKMARIEDGTNGEDGEDGHTPTQEELLALITPLIPKVKNGEDAVVDIDAIALKVLEKIPSPRADWGAHPLAIAQSGTVKEKIARHINFKGTGVSSVVRNPDGTVDVTITGGSGSFGVIAVTGTVDDSNTSFTAASAPSVVVVNGQSLRDGHGVTISGTTITLDNPAGTGGDIYAL